MNEGQYDSKNVEHISVENIEVVSNGTDWKTRHRLLLQSVYRLVVVQ